MSPKFRKYYFGEILNKFCSNIMKNLKKHKAKIFSISIALLPMIYV
jgi:hypothetical protein